MNVDTVRRASYPFWSTPCPLAITVALFLKSEVSFGEFSSSSIPSYTTTTHHLSINSNRPNLVLQACCKHSGAGLEIQVKLLP